QAKGEELDARSDIFSLGVVIYELLCGNHPFAAGSAAEIFSAILTREPPPLQRYGNDAHGELQRIISKCLEKDRDRRYQSAQELVLDLRSVQRGAGFGVLSAEKTSQPPRRKLRSFALAAVLLAIVTAIGVYWLSTRNNAIRSVAVLPFANINADP